MIERRLPRFTTTGDSAKACQICGLTQTPDHILSVFLLSNMPLIPHLRHGGRTSAWSQDGIMIGTSHDDILSAMAGRAGRAMTGCHGQTRPDFADRETGRTTRKPPRQ